jgi:protease-4
MQVDREVRPPVEKARSILLDWKIWILILLCAALGVWAASVVIPKPAVGLIYLDYDIHSVSAAYLKYQIEDVRSNPNIKAVVVYIDSPGGEVVASQSIYLELLELRKEMPVVGSIGNIAASGGYYAALATDPIFARPSSTVGNVGVWSTTPMDISVTETILASGPFKLSATNMEAFTRDLEAIKLEFLATVQAQRGSRLNLSSVELTQGLAYLGREAQQLGLIDFLGSDTDAVAKAAELAKIRDYEVIDMWQVLLERYAEEDSAEGSALEPSFFSQTWVGAADPMTSERQLPPGIYMLYDVRLRGEK